MKVAFVLSAFVVGCESLEAALKKQESSSVQVDSKNTIRSLKQSLLSIFTKKKAQPDGYTLYVFQLKIQITLPNDES